MQHIYEDLVMWYVANGGQRFVCPHFWVHDPTRKKWDSEPDLVALDFKERAIYVIEVNSGSQVADLARRVAKNARQACAYLIQNLQEVGVPCSDWPIKIRVFIRKSEQDTFMRALKRYAVTDALPAELNIQTIDLERTLTNWTWWDGTEHGVVSLDAGTPFTQT